MIHLYAFVGGLRSLPPCIGIAGEPLEIRSFDGVDAVVGTLGSAASESVECAVAHGLVAQALLDCADAVLSARFGGPFADDAALTEATGRRLPELRERLAGVRGCVELTVRMAPPATPRPAAVDGKTYLRDLAATTSARDSFVAEVHGALEPRALDSRIERLTRGGSLFRASYLVPRSRIEAFAHEVDGLGARFPGTSILCTGPWAPSSFAQVAA